MIKNDRQHKLGVEASRIDLIVSSTVAAHGHKSLTGRPIVIGGHFPYPTVEAKTRSNFHANLSQLPMVHRS